MKLIGKLQDGTVFFKKGHGEGEEPFEFKTDEGINRRSSDFVYYCNCHDDYIEKINHWCVVQNKLLKGWRKL